MQRRSVRARCIAVAFVAGLVLAGAQLVNAGQASAASCVASVGWTASAGKSYTTGSGLCIYNAAASYGKLDFQSDGNLVLYNARTGKALWASNTSGRGQRLAFQTDGNMVVYGCVSKGCVNGQTGAIWTSHTNFGIIKAIVEVGSNVNGPCWDESMWSPMSGRYWEVWQWAIDEACFGTVGSG